MAVGAVNPIPVCPLLCRLLFLIFQPEQALYSRNTFLSRMKHVVPEGS